jgi:2,4-dienoyl-CoA reductase-like NADH-dependent reductase (Old Yellow Enzyme family)/thioredoxin reductase
MTQLTKLFVPGRIGKMELKNRLVMPPIGTLSVDLEGYINQRTIDYYVERAKGGAGFIITQGASIVPEARMPHMMSLYDDKFIPELRKLTRAVQSYGTKIACQPTHTGIMLVRAWTGYERPSEIEDVGPSAVPCFTFQSTPREISREEIQRLIEAHAEAARRGKEADFDAVEIHGAHGYFLSAFLSPFRNKRTDEYGGSVENRARFACEIINRTREKVGGDFPILIRMNGSDFLEGGLTVDEAQRQAVMFVEAGVDAIDISAATQDSRQWRDLTYMHPDGALVHLAEAIRKAVKVPVITVGKIGDPILADQILQEGKADFVAMARPLLVDPELPNKAKEGRFDDIRRCIYCNNCRLGFLSQERIKTRGAGLACTVNPALLREREFALKPAPSPKKVMVIGGGLAGMEVARVLAERGHHVSLYEKSDELGGQWNIASSLPSKKIFNTLSRYLISGLNNAGVKVVLNKEVTRKFVEKQKPDAVVVATGASSLTLNVPGADGENVVQAVDVFAGKAEVGKRVVVIGGRLRGMEMADSLAEQGKEVSLVTLKRLGENGAPLERNVFVTLRDRLIQRRVMLFPHSPVYEIRNDGVYVVYDNELLFLPADTVVMAVGAKPENKLVAELQGLVSEVYAIGDCVQPRDAREAINEGAEVGRKI